jgi:hypothetical protein
MYFAPEPFNIGLALLTWVAAVGVVSAIGIMAAMVLALATQGMTGPAAIWNGLRRSLPDLLKISSQRVGAISTLTVRESFRRNDVMVGVVFVLLFAFAGWFLSSSNIDKPAKPYISFVLTAIRWLILPVALLLACWGLPADIKARSLHTVVTKPVRRSEVVLGRMLGYSFVITLGMLIMGLVGYIWIQRYVPEDARAQLISRVPIYGQVRFTTRTGEPSRTGLNVGDIWNYRSFVEGNTKGRAVYEFSGISPARVLTDDGLRLEYRFEVFRSHKGDIERSILAQFEFVNEEAGLRVPYPPVPFEVREFADIQTRSSREGGRAPVVIVPRKLTYTPEGETVPKTVDLIDDVATNGTLRVDVRCADSSQYLGASQTDLFIRTPDRSFASGYFKAILGTWLMAVLVIVLGTTASTFVKGPVATLLTFTLILTGLTMRPFMSELLGQYLSEGQVDGGGMFESAYRIVTQMNMQTALQENIATSIIQFVDARIHEGLLVLQFLIPDFTDFDMTPYVANGFDVPLNSALLPSIVTTLAFVLPCLVVGYLSLQWRELESK